jgi:hypothetical protein
VDLKLPQWKPGGGSQELHELACLLDQTRGIQVSVWIWKPPCMRAREQARGACSRGRGCKGEDSVETDKSGRHYY